MGTNSTVAIGTTNPPTNQNAAWYLGAAKGTAADDMTNIVCKGVLYDGGAAGKFVKVAQDYGFSNAGSWGSMHRNAVVAVIGDGGARSIQATTPLDVVSTWANTQALATESIE